MEIFISSTPTIEKDDLELTKKLLKSNNLEVPDIKLPGFENNNYFFTNTGRSSLYILLKALNITQDDEVILQSFTCMAVVVPLLWLNIKAIFADIKEDTYNISLESIKSKITQNTKAVILQHTFGIPADIVEIKKYIEEINKSREYKIYLIEDCAHSLNIKYQDKYLGSFGDASFFSFGQDKVISCTQGGCIICNDKDIEKRVSDIYNEIPNMDEKDVKYNLRYPIYWDIIKRFYFKPSFIAKNKRLSIFTIGKFLIILFRYLGLIKQQASINNFGNPDTDVCKLSDKQKVLLNNQLKKLERFSEHRTNIVDIYSKALGSNLSGSLLRYPVFVDDPSRVKNVLQSMKVLSGNWYNYPIIPKGIDLNKMGYHVGTCVNTEYLMEHIINLPTDIQVSEDSAREIIGKIS